MNARLRNWIINDHEWADEKSQQDFLRKLKFTPAQTLQTISSQIEEWSELVSQLTGEPIIVANPDLESREILVALQKYYAGELAAITEQTSEKLERNL